MDRMRIEGSASLFSHACHYETRTEAITNRPESKHRVPYSLKSFRELIVPEGILLTPFEKRKIEGHL